MLRRLLYDEMLRRNTFPNRKSSRILGFCLNVMSLKTPETRGAEREHAPLKKAMLSWTKKNYLRLRNIQPDVARSCLMGNISFDEQGNRLVATYAKGLAKEDSKIYLDLNKVEHSA